MPTQPTKSDACTPKLSAKLRALRELRHPDRPLKVEQIADAFVCSESTAYRILEGQFDEQLAMLRHAIATGPADLADAVLGVLLCGTEYAVPVRGGESVETDLNNDGKTDLADQLQSVVGLMAECQEPLEQVAAAAGSGRRMLGEEQAASLDAKLSRIIVGAVTARAITSRITLRRQPGMRAAM